MYKREVSCSKCSGIAEKQVVLSSQSPAVEEANPRARETGLLIPNGLRW